MFDTFNGFLECKIRLLLQRETVAWSAWTKLNRVRVGSIGRKAPPRTFICSPLSHRNAILFQFCIINEHTIIPIDGNNNLVYVLPSMKSRGIQVSIHSIEVLPSYLCTTRVERKCDSIGCNLILVCIVLKPDMKIPPERVAGVTGR